MVQGSSLESFFLLFWPFVNLFVCYFVTISFFFYLLAGFNLFILLSHHSFGSCCNKHISSYLLFVHMLTTGFFFFSKGPRGFDGFRGLKGSKV